MKNELYIWKLDGERVLLISSFKAWNYQGTDEVPAPYFIATKESAEQLQAGLNQTILYTE